jgi:type IV pilus assembly protein PilW
LDQIATDYAVDADVTRAGFMQGDMILAIPLAANPPPDCTLGEITGLPVVAPPAGCQCTADCVTGATNLINHNDVKYRSVYASCGEVTAAWNKAGAGVAYNAGSRVYNLGPVGAFVSRVYAVRKGNLTMCDLTLNDCTDKDKADSADGGVWVPIAASVMGLKAQYGKDDINPPNGVVDSWNATQPTGAARAQVIALRLAVAVRSGQYEKEEVTTVAPVWQPDATSTSNTALFDITKPPTEDWKHYRYKSAQSVVPLRNMIWGEQLQ